jgi:23S rRNA pseudouridine2604 synthase
MCEYLDYQVLALQRIRIMNVELDLPVGHWRDLTKAELKEINRLVATSTKTHFDTN